MIKAENYEANRSIFISEVRPYKITYSTWEGKGAGTISPQYVVIKGTDGETDEHLCEANFHVLGEDVVCEFQSPGSVGDYRCTTLRTGGSDGIDLVKVINNRITSMVTNQLVHKSIR